MFIKLLGKQEPLPSEGTISDGKTVFRVLAGPEPCWVLSVLFELCCHGLEWNSVKQRLLSCQLQGG